MYENCKKILIIGANGFIGNSLSCNLLAKTNNECYCVDLAGNNLQHCFGHKRFHFYELNLLKDDAAIEKLVKTCDIIIPLAAYANPETYLKRPLAVFELNFEANLKIVRLCDKYAKRVIFPSTSEVYGIITDQEADEYTTNCVIGPIKKQRWIYSCAKQMMDRVLYAYGFEKNLDYTIFRPFNFIGPKEDNVVSNNSNGGRVIPKFMHAILDHKPLKLIDGGINKRCFTYINDGIDCLLKMIENANGCATREIFNIGNSNENYSIFELANIIKEVVYKFDNKLADSIKFENVSSKQYYGDNFQEPSRRVPAVKNAKQKLKWEAKTTLRESLHYIVDFLINGVDKDVEMLKNAK